MIPSYIIPQTDRTARQTIIVENEVPRIAGRPQVPFADLVAALTRCRQAREAPAAEAAPTSIFEEVTRPLVTGSWAA